VIARWQVLREESCLFDEETTPAESLEADDDVTGMSDVTENPPSASLSRSSTLEGENLNGRSDDGDEDDEDEVFLEAVSSTSIYHPS
jgi:hypothetical protein